MTDEISDARTAARRMRMLGISVVAAVACVAIAAGFFWFASLVSHEGVALERNADGIVALTGGAERIGDAVELLAAGHGQRLLITGVNRTTRAAELSRLVPRYQRLFDCCIDIDHSAVNTIGNAIEARRWVRERGVRSLVVVTSAYHMPRAMAELAHQLPDVTLIAFPVITERQRAEPWWQSATSVRLLVSEYLKYLASVVRMRFDAVPASEFAVAGQPAHP